jgi:hypothetical protein
MMLAMNSHIVTLHYPHLHIVGNIWGAPLQSDLESLDHCACTSHLNLQTYIHDQVSTVGGPTSGNSPLRMRQLWCLAVARYRQACRYVLPKRRSRLEAGRIWYGNANVAPRRDQQKRAEAVPEAYRWRSNRRLGVRASKLPRQGDANEKTRTFFSVGCISRVTICLPTGLRYVTLKSVSRRSPFMTAFKVPACTSHVPVNLIHCRHVATNLGDRRKNSKAPKLFVAPSDQPRSEQMHTTPSGDFMLTVTFLSY